MRYTKESIIKDSTMSIRGEARQRFIDAGRQEDWDKTRRNPAEYIQVLTSEQVKQYLDDDHLSPLLTLYSNEWPPEGQKLYGFFSADILLFNKGGIIPNFKGFSFTSTAGYTYEYLLKTYFKDHEMIYCLDHLVEVCNTEYDKIIIPA